MVVVGKEDDRYKVIEEPHHGRSINGCGEGDNDFLRAGKTRTSPKEGQPENRQYEKYHHENEDRLIIPRRGPFNHIGRQFEAAMVAKSRAGSQFVVASRTPHRVGPPEVAHESLAFRNMVSLTVDSVKHVRHPEI